MLSSILLKLYMSRTKNSNKNERHYQVYVSLFSQWGKNAKKVIGFNANFCNCRSNNRTNMELNSANKNPSHDSFIVCIDKQAYKLSLQITKNVKNSEKLK